MLANLAAKRAKQLIQGTPLVHIDSRHPLSIALAEIAAGKIRPIVPEEGTELIIDTSDDIGNELGILLPALDDAEVELLGSDLIIEDHDDHADVETGASITDMLVDDPEVEAEVEVVEPEEDTLSLNELAEQEEGESENAEPEA